MKYIQQIRTILLINQTQKYLTIICPKYFLGRIFYGAQMSYLSKEESIGGSFGLETRYPFRYIPSSGVLKSNSRIKE